MSENGGEPLMWKTGHSLVKAKMQETGAPLGGEMSGHIVLQGPLVRFRRRPVCRRPPARADEPREPTPSAVLNAMPQSTSTPELQSPEAE